MNDLLKKLNTLIKANLSNAVNDALDEVTARLPKRSPNLDKQVAELRERINAALEYEDSLARRVSEIQAEVATLDEAVEVALSAGDDAQARALLGQLQRTEQRLTMAEADLKAHQRSAEELIRQVNLLDATIADNKAATQPASPEEPAETHNPVSGDAETAAATTSAATASAATASTAMDRISGALRDAQERTRARLETLAKMASTEGQSDEVKTGGNPPAETESIKSTGQVSKDAAGQARSEPSENASSDASSGASSDAMSARLARLSNPAAKAGNKADPSSNSDPDKAQE